MANDREIEILIKAKEATEQAFERARKQMAALKGEVSDSDAKVKGISASLRGFADEHKKSFQAVGAGIGIVAGAIGVVGAAIVALGVRGSTVADVRGHFDLLTKSVGSTAAEMLGALKRATGGTITDFELMKSTNIGLSQGLKLTANDLDITGKAARVLADRLGGDTKQAYDSLIQVMATGQDKKLKGIGVDIDAENAVLRHARALGREAESLSEAEKKAAIKAATMAALTRVLEESGEAEDDFADKLDKAQAGFQNVLDRMGEAIASSPVVSAALDAIGESLEQAFGVANQQNVKTLVGYVDSGAFIVLKFADAGITTADIVGRAWNGLKLIFAGTMSVLSSAVLVLASVATKAYELAAALPGAGAQYRALGNEAKTLRDFMEGVQKSFHDQAEEALNGVQGNSAYHGMLDKVRAGLETVRAKMQAASTTAVESTKTTKTQTAGVREFGEENLKAADKAEKAANRFQAGLAKAKLALHDLNIAEYYKHFNRELEINQLRLHQSGEAWVFVQQWIKQGHLELRDFKAQLEDVTRERLTRQMNADWEQQYEQIRKNDAALDDFSGSLAELARVSEGTFLGMLAGLGSVIAAWPRAQKAADAYYANASAKSKAIGAAAGIVSGAASIAGATDPKQGGGAGRGALAGAAAGMNPALLAVTGGWSVVIGAAAGAIAGYVRSLGQGRDAVKAFAASHGDFDQLHAKLGALGAKGEQLWINLTQGVGRNNPTQAKAAIDAITAALKGQEDQTARGEAAIQKWGFIFEELGPKLQNSRVREFGKDLFDDWEALQFLGVDTNAMIERMGGSVNEFFQKAKQTGIEVPAAWRPMLEQMVTAGKLLDEDGNKIEKLEGSGVTFATSLTEGFKGIVGELKNIADILSGRIPQVLDGVFRNVPREIEIDVRARRTGDWSFVDDGRGDESAGFTRGTPRLDYVDFGRASRTVLHGQEAVIPRSGVGQFAAQVASALASAQSSAPVVTPIVNVGVQVGAEQLRDVIVNIVSTAMAQGFIGVPAHVVQRRVAYG